MKQQHLLFCILCCIITLYAPIVPSQGSQTPPAATPSTTPITPQTQPPLQPTIPSGAAPMATIPAPQPAVMPPPQAPVSAPIQVQPQVTVPLAHPPSLFPPAQTFPPAASPFPSPLFGPRPPESQTGKFAVEAPQISSPAPELTPFASSFSQPTPEVKPSTPEPENLPIKAAEPLPTEEIVTSTEDVTLPEISPEEVENEEKDEDLIEEALESEDEDAEESAVELPKLLEEKPLFGEASQKKYDPFFVIKKNETLAHLIERIAAKRGVNIILPSGPEAIKEAVSFPENRKMRLSEAEKYLQMLLTMSGYSVNPNGPYFKVIKQSENNLTREPLPLFVDIAPEQLPQSDEFIRAIFYLANFRVPDSTQGSEPVNLMLKEMLGARHGYFFDQKSNAIFMIAPSRKIAAVMSLILKLDEAGSKEKLIVIPLFNASSTIVAKLLNEQIITTTQDARRRLTPSVKMYDELYFMPNTRIFPDTRTNSLVVIGQEPALMRIQDLVRNALDQMPETGRSVLHVYDLQYLKAEEFVGTVKSIVQGTMNEQARKEGTGGPQRLFDEPIVVAETIGEALSKTATSADAKEQTFKIGGNRLIIAANNDDWFQIKSLIEQLDKPQLQVILEVMIVDLTSDANKKLKSQVRNPSLLSLPQGVQAQSANITTQILDDNTAPKTLASDLLRLLGGSPNQSMAVAASSGLNAGSMIIALKDPNTDGIWNVLQLLDGWVETNILAHPFLVTQNNVQAVEKVTEYRRSAGGIADGSTAVTTIKQYDYAAQISVTITPRISSIDRLTLQISVYEENFVDPNTLSRVKRTVETSSTLNTGQVLVLGGLTRINDIQTETVWPILGYIPIIGNLFRGTTREKIRSNLAIFIHPTIVDPKLRSGLAKQTADKTKVAGVLVEESELFSHLQDPVTRFFFADYPGTDGSDLFMKYQNDAAKKQRPDSEQTAATDTIEELRRLKDKYANAKNPLIKA